MLEKTRTRTLKPTVKISNYVDNWRIVVDGMKTLGALGSIIFYCEESHQVVIRSYWPLESTSDGAKTSLRSDAKQAFKFMEDSKKSECDNNQESKKTDFNSTPPDGFVLKGEIIANQNASEETHGPTP